jgi:putative membrane protein
MHSTVRNKIALYSGLAVLGATMGMAQTGNMSPPASSSQASAADRHFVQEATEGSNPEIALGKLAQQKSTSDDVKQFGQKMVTDHTQLNSDMAPVAEQMGVTPPADKIPAKDQALQSKLEGLSGQQFDQAYIKAMVKDHRKDVAKFKHEAATTKDPTLKQTVEKGEQVIQEHLNLAEQLAQAHHVQVGGASSAAASQ